MRPQPLIAVSDVEASSRWYAPGDGPYRNGELLWFETEECWLRDPDGYTVVLASPDGSAP